MALSTVEAGNNVSATFRNEHPFPMYLSVPQFFVQHPFGFGYVLSLQVLEAT